MDGYRAIISAIIVMLAGVLVCAQAQWLNYPTPGTPRTRDGKANLAASTPRTLDHRPDLSGVWQVDPAAGEAERLLGHVLDSGVVPVTTRGCILSIFSTSWPTLNPIKNL